MDLVSIIIPCYNKAQYLAETLKSVQNQTYCNLEIIVVDDGSTDNTKQIVSQWQQRLPFFHYLWQENQGPSVARNNGIRFATGTYIVCLDADDLIHPQYVERCANYLTTHPNVKLVYTRAQLFGERNEEWILPNYDFTTLLWENMINCAAMYRKVDFNRTVGYNTNMINGLEDWDFWLTFLSPTDQVIQLEEPLLSVRLLRDSRTSDADSHERELLQQIYHNHQELYAPYLEDIIYFHTRWQMAEFHRRKAEESRQSKAYRLGKALLHPFTWIKEKTHAR